MIGLNFSGVRRMRIFRQAEAAECGLACVGMVASAYGYDTDLVTLRRDYPISLKGATLKDIIGVADQIGLSARPIRCSLIELRDIRKPAILHWNMKHFVVLRKATRKSVEIIDPAHGKIVLSLHEAGQHFTGVALELTPSAAFQKKRERNPVKLFSLVKIDSTGWKAIGQALALSAFLQIFVLLSPYYMQIVIDEAILKGDVSLLTAVALGFVLLKLFEALTTIVRGLIVQFLTSVLSYDMEAALIRHMVRLPLPFFHKRQVGDIQQRFESLDPIRDFIANGAITALIDGVFAIFLGIIIFLYNALLGFVVVGFILVYAILRLAFLSVSKRLSGEWLIADARENTKFLETLRAMQAIKVSGIEIERETLSRNLAAETLNAKIRMGNVQIGYDAISQTLMGISNILVIYLAATNAIAGSMTIGMISAFVAYKSQFEQKLMALLEQWIQFMLLEVHLERVSDIALSSKEANLDAPPIRSSYSGALQLDGVYFRYGNFEPLILSGASLTVEPGEFVAISAPSGAGKSTLLKVMLSLYDTTNGRVLYDGLDASQWGKNNLRRHLGVVMQDDTLFAGSIEENIALFDERPDHDWIRECAKIAQIHVDIDKMPMGYRSLVGDMGTSLSGGQQQRIILARALYRRPKLLVLDEATSAVDMRMEQAINASLKELEITRIVAAHRAETLASADKIYALKKGRLIKIDASMADILKKKPTQKANVLE